ncbi:MAG: hypothetical protein JXX28_12595, partial [Deltaproteobacteria bacterium]|nr:hypothetical protein [Deltaproteobacteria bacterium]
RWPVVVGPSLGRRGSIAFHAVTGAWITPDEAVVMELACRTTESLGRLEVRMTQPLIVEEAAKRDVHLSRSFVQRILARAEVKPHRTPH